MENQILARLTYPDPFRPAGLEFTLPTTATVSVIVADTDGTILKTLADDAKMQEGRHVLEFDLCSGQRGGSYVYLKISMNDEEFQFVRPISGGKTG